MIPYWRLSAAYTFYFAALGAWVPFWGVYLQALGLDAIAIGKLSAWFMVARIIAPLVIGNWADRMGRCLLLVRWTAFGAVGCFLGVIWAGPHYYLLALTTLCFSFCWNAALPQLEAATFNHLGEQRLRYSRIRLWGSLGFIAAVALLGALLMGGERIYWLPWVIFSLLVGLWIASWLIPETHSSCHPATPVSFLALLRRPAVMAFFMTCFLMQASHAPYYVFYSLYLEQYGYSGTVIGLLWALGVFAEVLLFMRVDSWMQLYGVSPFLSASLLLAALRWIILAVSITSVSWLIVAQWLHAASFGLYHAAAIQLTHQLFKGPHHSKGQALYGSLFGLGGAFGGLYSGYCWAWGGPMLAYGVAAGLCLLGLLFAVYGLKRDMLKAELKE